MSDLSISLALGGAENASARVSRSGSKSAPVTGAAGHPAKVDVTNFVTSPKGVVDPESGVYVLQYRDGATGEVLNQYPSAKVVDAYKRGDSTNQQPTVHGSNQGSGAATSPVSVEASVGAAVPVAAPTTSSSVDAGSVAVTSPAPRTSVDV
ncbi:MAG: hypothetical protein NUV50_02210 [Rhodospirillales bacterium]|nr:hypothetical protein [Rhodospirillales bacterium]